MDAMDGSSAARGGVGKRLAQVLVGVLPCWLSVLAACVGAYYLARWAELKACEMGLDMLAASGQALLRFRWAFIVLAVAWTAVSGLLCWLACRRWPPAQVIVYTIAAALLTVTVVCVCTAFGLMGVFAGLDPFSPL